MTICCLGDLVLDVIVRLEQPLAADADATSRIVLRTGGQAANVAAWIAELGGDARLIGKRGGDDAGVLAASRLLELGVDLVGPVEPEGNGVIVSLVEPDGGRTMCADRGVAVDLRPEEIDDAWFADCAHLHVSGYALLREPVRHAAVAAIEPFDIIAILAILHRVFVNPTIEQGYLYPIRRLPCGGNIG